MKIYFGKCSVLLMFIMIDLYESNALPFNKLIIFSISSQTIHDSVSLESHNSHPEMAKIAFAGLREPWAFQFVGRFSLAPTSDIDGSGSDTADRGFGS